MKNDINAEQKIEKNNHQAQSGNTQLKDPNNENNFQLKVEDQENLIQKLKINIDSIYEKNSFTGSILLNEAIEFARSSDFENAKRYMEAAAEIGNIDAIHYMGIYYEIGIGCTQNNSNALDWFVKAKKIGYPNSDKDISRITNEIK